MWWFAGCRAATCSRRCWGREGQRQGLDEHPVERAACLPLSGLRTLLRSIPERRGIHVSETAKVFRWSFLNKRRGRWLMGLGYYPGGLLHSALDYRTPHEVRIAYLKDQPGGMKITHQPSGKRGVAHSYQDFQCSAPELGSPAHRASRPNNHPRADGTRNHRPRNQARDVQ
jgi:hypothetical protein